MAGLADSFPLRRRPWIALASAVPSDDRRRLSSSFRLSVTNRSV